jgi:hypothetical protein
MIARIENGIVVQVIEGSVEWAAFNLEGDWIDCENQTCGIGYSFEDGLFIPPQPFASWTLQGSNWVAAIEKPEGMFCWDEETLNWIENV